MNNIYFSFIIPVFNRPNEILELLQSMQRLEFDEEYEIVIVEDGSSETSEHLINDFKYLNISYYFKPNSGPGDSRNYGMKKAKGNYFLILDSDVILPANYLKEAEKELTKKYVDCFGGVDNAHDSFTDLQKAINYVMTSFLTTGGIRGGGEQLGKFQPRSFNMGLSKKAFESSKGFGSIHPGEDPDLSIRLWNLGFETALFSSVQVFHKRRISWKKFQQQVVKFGKCRPILNHWHPKTSKLTYWFPSVFSILGVVAIVMAVLGQYLYLALYTLYFVAVLLESTYKNKTLKIGLMSIYATIIQFFGYGKGFLTSFMKINIFKQKPQTAFPYLFFKK